MDDNSRYLDLLKSVDRLDSSASQRNRTKPTTVSERSDAYKIADSSISGKVPSGTNGE